MNELVEKLDVKVLGERLQKVRQHLKMTQADVAKEIGCAPLTISRMERGEITTSTVAALVFYSISVDMNRLLSKNFDVKARLQLLEQNSKGYIANMQQDFKDNVKIIIEKHTEDMFQDLNKRMMEATKQQSEDLLKSLEKTIELL